MAHICYPNPWEAEAGRESGVHSESETGLDSMRLAPREELPGVSAKPWGPSGVALEKGEVLNFKVLLPHWPRSGSVCNYSASLALASCLQSTNTLKR